MASEVSLRIEWPVVQQARRTQAAPADRANSREEARQLNTRALCSNISQMSDLPQSDVSRPSKLPTANLLPQGAAPPAVEQTSAEYLEAIEEEWNKRVDVEIDTLADGMVDLVNLASVSRHGISPSVVLTTALWSDQQQRQI